jgi:molybdopterin converting factor small subunit
MFLTIQYLLILWVSLSAPFLAHRLSPVLMGSPITPQEVPNYAIRVVTQIQVSQHPHRGQPSSGSTDRHPGLGGVAQRAQQIRRAKLKNAAGRPPHLRTTLGTMVLRAIRKLTYREAEDLVQYYAPARYLCGLTETQWTPDFTTIQDFAELMGEEGVRLINQYVVQLAVKHKLANPKILVADTTAQEAAIPYPNEMGLMAGFLRSVAAAAAKVGQGLKGFMQQTVSQFRAARHKAREYRLFAKSKESKDQVMGQMLTIVEKLNEHLGKALGAIVTQGAKLCRD